MADERSSEPKRRESGFQERPQQAARPEKNRYHREVDELDYIIPKTFHEHDDRDVWKPRRGRDQAVQQFNRDAEFSGRRGPGGERPFRDGAYTNERYGRRRESDRGARPRSRERMHSDRPEYSRPTQNGDQRRPSTRELARMDFERSRSRPDRRQHNDQGGDEKPQDAQKPEGDHFRQQSAGWSQGRNWKRGAAETAEKWGHDKFDEIKDLPPEKKDPLDFLYRRF